MSLALSLSRTQRLQDRIHYIAIIRVSGIDDCVCLTGRLTDDARVSQRAEHWKDSICLDLLCALFRTNQPSNLMACID